MSSLLVLETPRLNYGESLKLQKAVETLVLQGKITDTLILTEHAPVVTAGRSAKSEDLLLTEEALRERGIDRHEIDRGGEWTYHGPGQVVGYPIFNLKKHGEDVGGFLRNLETVLMKTLEEYGLKASQRKPWTGVWLNPHTTQERKIAAIGVHLKKWVSTHGIALNVNNDPKDFSVIVPCGLKESGVTSMRQELGHDLDLDLIRKMLIANFVEVFRFNAFERISSEVLKNQVSFKSDGTLSAEVI